MTHYRKCLQIKATDSPNVAYALHQQKLGRVPTGEVIIPGVLTWDEYQGRLRTYDEQRKTESLDADWYEGEAVRLVPKQWVYGVEGKQGTGAIAYSKRRPQGNFTRYMGCDPGEGGDDSCWVVGDRHGIIEVVSMKTGDTNKVISVTMDLQYRHKIEWENICFDEGSGGGGRVHIDRLWANGKRVRGVGFGATPQIPLRRGMTQFPEKRDQRADKYAFVHCRDEMAFDIRIIMELDSDGVYVARRPQEKVEGFAIPDAPSTQELIRQLLLIPYSTDGEGRMKLPPKRNPLDSKDPNTLVYMVGHSPDQFDAFCLMIYALCHKPLVSHAGAR